MISSTTNILIPFIASFTVFFSTVFIIGFTIIYYCFKDQKEVDENNIEMEQKSIVYLDNEYRLARNKNVDSEANLPNMLQTEERNLKMEEEVKDGKNNDD